MGEEGLTSAQQPSVDTGGYDSGGGQSATYDNGGSSDNYASPNSYGSSNGDSGSDYGNADSNAISARMSDGRTMVMETDPRTGRQTLKFVDNSGQAVASSDATQDVVNNSNGYTKYADEASQKVFNELPPYTLSEMSNAIANNVVDERRVPQEYQQQFADFKLQQAIQLYNINQQAAIQQQQAQQQQLQQQLAEEPAQRQARTNEFYARLNDEAKKLALAEMGMTQEEYENVDFSDEDDVAKLENFKIAMEVNRSKLVQQVTAQAQREQQVRSEIENNYKEADDFIKAARKNEPHYEEINLMMATRYQNMPYKEAKAIDDATEAFKGGYATQKDLETIRNYYESSRKEFYAKQINATPPRPRYAETSGYGRDTAKQDAGFDFKKFGASNNKDQRAMIARFLYGDR